MRFAVACPAPRDLKAKYAIALAANPDADLAAEGASRCRWIICSWALFSFKLEVQGSLKLKQVQEVLPVPSFTGIYTGFQLSRCAGYA